MLCKDLVEILVSNPAGPAPRPVPTLSPSLRPLAGPAPQLPSALTPFGRQLAVWTKL